MHVQKERSYISGRKITALDNFDVTQYEGLNKIGINLNRHAVKMMMDGRQAIDRMYGMDALQPTVTTGSVGTPVQFLQEWLPGFVFVITAARKIDEFIGILNTGSWEDEQVVQGILERTGVTLPYGDYTNVPLSSWNTNFNYRTVVRFEEGMKVGVLESA